MREKQIYIYTNTQTHTHTRDTHTYIYIYVCVCVYIYLHSDTCKSSAVICYSTCKIYIPPYAPMYALHLYTVININNKYKRRSTFFLVFISHQAVDSFSKAIYDMLVKFITNYDMIHHNKCNTHSSW